MVDFDREWLSEFSQCKKFDRLYDEWVRSDYKKEFKPSLDRILCKKGYLVNNVQWLSWSENRYKQTMERRCRKGPVIQKQGDKVIKIHISQRKAVMDTGITQSNMSSCLNGKRQTAGGYNWEFQHPELMDIGNNND